MDGANAASWWILVVLIVFVGLLSQAWFLRLLYRLGERMYARAAAKRQEPEGFDPEQAYLWNCLRRERLQDDLTRISRLLITDTHMSATRQLGNRLAYDQLMHELRQEPAGPAYEPVDLLTSPTARPVATVGATRPTIGYGSSAASMGAPKVEVLDIGWRGHSN